MKANRLLFDQLVEPRREELEVMSGRGERVGWQGRKLWVRSTTGIRTGAPCPKGGLMLTHDNPIFDERSTCRPAVRERFSR